MALIWFPCLLSATQTSHCDLAGGFQNLLQIAIFLCPYKRQSLMLCFVASDFTNNWNIDAGKVCHRENYQYITNTCAFVESQHCFAWFVVCSPVIVKALLHDFDPYIHNVLPVLYVPRSCEPVLLAMQWGVASRSAFYRGRETIMNSLQL